MCDGLRPAGGRAEHAGSAAEEGPAHVQAAGGIEARYTVKHK